MRSEARRIASTTRRADALSGDTTWRRNPAPMTIEARGAFRSWQMLASRSGLTWRFAGRPASGSKSVVKASTDGMYALLGTAIGTLAVLCRRARPTFELSVERPTIHAEQPC